ncbi:Zinc finger protein SHOOT GRAVITROPISM 5 [Linum perenne]
MFPIAANNDESAAATAAKRKRRPAGTPDPDAEVVFLSPKTLMESDKYVCEICNQGFQRDQNLQMHRRRHKVPWKLLKSDTSASSEMRKRVFVCPEPGCLHHDPCHALGDLVGIKKHYRRKHSGERTWVCEKCGKGYAVQSDYKAHLKSCGTRGHSCDCGRVFSRVESFIEHQDTCTISRLRPANPPLPFQPTSSPSPPPVQPPPPPPPPSNHQRPAMISLFTPFNLDLQLCSPSFSSAAENTQLQLSVGRPNSADGDLMRAAAAEKAYAEEARREARRQIQLAEDELANAKRTRQRAQAELDRAESLKEQAMMVSSGGGVLLNGMLTCTSCRQKFAAAAAAGDENSLVVSYVSSGVTDHGGEVDKGRSFCDR